MTTFEITKKAEFNSPNDLGLYAEARLYREILGMVVIVVESKHAYLCWPGTKSNLSEAVS